MLIVRLLQFILVVALLSTAASAKTDPALGQQKAISPFVKSTVPSASLWDQPSAPTPAPAKVRRSKTIYPAGSISGRNYVGFELGLTAGMLTAGEVEFLFPYPYDNIGRGDIQAVGPIEDHSIALRYSIGGVLDYAINNMLSLQSKVTYRALGASGEKQTQFQCFIAGTTPQAGIATFTETYEIDLSYLGLDVLSRIGIIKDGLYGLAGFGISSMVGSEVDAREEISSPNNCQYTFSSGPITNQYVSESRDMDVADDLLSTRFDIRAGVGTFISLSKNMVLVPELTFGIPLTSFASPNTSDRFGMRTTEPPLHAYAALSVGLKFPWGNYDGAAYDSTWEEDGPDGNVIGYIEVRDGDVISGNLSGRIVDESGNPINDASIVVVDLGTNRVVAQEDAKDGNYNVQVEGAGRYSVTADAPGYLFGSTMFEIGEDGRIMKQAGDIKLSRSSDGRVRLLIFFESNKAVLQSSSYPELNRAAVLMNANPTMEVEIAGYTDSKGSDAHNLDLSQRRAESVKSYIAAQGVDVRRLIAIGYGEASPISTNDTEEGRAENRRVEFVVRRK